MLKIVIADDSLLYRNLLRDSLAGFSSVNIVDDVRCGAHALESVEKNDPHLLILDLKMPDMDGWEVMRKIKRLRRMKQLKTEVVILTGVSDITEPHCTAKGAIGLIKKPSLSSVEENKVFLRAAIDKVLNETYKTPKAATPKPKPKTTYNMSFSHDIRAIVIGSSTGAPRVICDILPKICELTTVPIFISQHMQKGFTAKFAKTLTSKCATQTIEINKAMIVEPNHVYLAEGGRHMVIKRGRGDVLVTPDDDSPVNGHRPSVDVLFKGAANIYGNSALGIILSGMGNDGANGSLILKNAGATILAQDEATSAVWGMPKSAIDLDAVDFVLSPDEIVKKIESIIRGNS